MNNSQFTAQNDRSLGRALRATGQLVACLAYDESTTGTVIA